MEKRWVLKDPGDPVLVSSLAKQINVNETIASLLVQRGVDTYEKLNAFSGHRLPTCTTHS